MSLKSWGSVKDYDRDELAEQYEEDLARDASFWKPQPGENEIRLLPPPNQRRPYRVREQHWVRTANKKQSFNCPKVEKEDAKCFLCDVSNELKASSSKEDRDRGYDLRAKPQWLYIILDMEHPKKGPQVYGAPKTVHADIAKIVTDKKDYGPIVLDPVDGYNLILTRDGTTQNDTEYSVRGRIKPEDVSEWLAEVVPPDLSQYCTPADNEDMQKFFEDEGDEAPAAEQPRSRRREVDDEPRRSRDDDDVPRRAARDDDDAPRGRRERADASDDEPKRPGRRLGSSRRDDD